MTKHDLTQLLLERFAACSGNVIAPEAALTPDLAGLVLFEAPLVGVARAEDPLFEEFRRGEVVGPWHMTPRQWLPSAKSVVSLFFPFTEQVKASQRKERCATAPAWLYGRVEGQNFIHAYMRDISAALGDAGISCCAPCIDSRFHSISGGDAFPGYPPAGHPVYASNWSERHAAYACGLGTFGLSGGIITKKGMAGRLSSIILDVELEPDRRPYTGIYDYCIFCGACARRCPAQAIQVGAGKDHGPCSQRLKESRVLYAPRYGCGSCQTAVPCESKIPLRPKRACPPEDRY